MEESYAVSMLGITKRFPGVTALNGVDLRVRKGEVHALLGENGAGKSTLIKILSGVYRQDEGEIQINGSPTVIRGPEDAREKGVSAIHQDLNLIPFFDATQNIFVGRERDSSKGLLLERRRMSERAKALLEDLNIDIPVNRPVRKLTVAQQQMVAIARALSENARILIMDEPTAMLSGREIRQLFSIIEHLRKSGVTIIYISHRLEEVLDIADSVTVLKDGVVSLSCSIEEVTLEQIIEAMVGGKMDQQFLERVSRIGSELLRVEDLSDGRLVKGVSLRVRAGEVVGITGTVGAGKSEIARAIFGASRSAGRIWVEGKEVNIRSPRDAIAVGLALVPEDRRGHGLIVEESVSSNIVLPFLSRLATFGFVNRVAEKETVVRLVDSFRVLTPSIKQKVMFLSGGNQQKVVLAKWFGAKARVYILDEPTQGIDVGAKREVYRFINQLVEEGNGVLFISSDIPEVIGVADVTLVVSNGEIVARFGRNEATQEKVLMAMLGSGAGGDQCARRD
ncbi:MAG: sugar ABC transporter ATP-binding protein [Firmicutes bacterium]|nr:sugar ABC transporter ATP-binding protein [Candidatus Fermentithermobacillaceae bacterium]